MCWNPNSSPIHAAALIHFACSSGSEMGFEDAVAPSSNARCLVFTGCQAATKFLNAPCVKYAEVAKAEEEVRSSGGLLHTCSL